MQLSHMYASTSTVMTCNYALRKCCYAHPLRLAPCPVASRSLTSIHSGCGLVHIACQRRRREECVARLDSWGIIGGQLQQVQDCFPWTAASAALPVAYHSTLLLCLQPAAAPSTALFHSINMQHTMQHNAVCADLLGLAGQVTAGRQQLAMPSVASRLGAVHNNTSTPDSPGYSQAQVSVVVDKVVEVIETHCLWGP